MLRSVLRNVGSVCILMSATSPIMLCCGIAASDVSKFFHNWLIYVVVTAFVGFVSFTASQIVD